MFKQKFFLVSLLVFVVAFFLFHSPFLYSQNNPVLDSLVKELPKMKSDTNAVLLLNNIGIEYRKSHPDSAEVYYSKALALAKELYFEKGVADVENNYGLFYYIKGDYLKATEHLVLALEKYEKLKTNKGALKALANLCIIYNPLWVARKNEVIKVKADKQPIVSLNWEELLPLILMNCKKETTSMFFSMALPISSGPKGKKFKYAKLKELLLANADKPMAEQKEILQQVFYAWKGELEQIVDICLIGVKIQ